MLTRRWFGVLALACFIGLTAALPRTNASAVQEETLHIDIPTQFEKANVVVDFGHLVLNADMPFALGDIHLLASDYQQWGTKGQVVVIFHGDAAHLVLNDSAYDLNRHVTTGNPYKGLMDELMKQGVQLELCGATAKGNHWGNADLLTGIKVNVNAMVRVTQLEQEGFTLIYQ
jgi:intracellular sulfur oxidation DsrE/DsrF family protein